MVSQSHWHLTTISDHHTQDRDSFTGHLFSAILRRTCSREPIQQIKHINPESHVMPGHYRGCSFFKGTNRGQLYLVTGRRCGFLLPFSTFLRCPVRLRHRQTEVACSSVLHCLLRNVWGSSWRWSSSTHGGSIRSGNQAYPECWSPETLLPSPRPHHRRPGTALAC